MWQIGFSFCSTFIFCHLVCIANLIHQTSVYLCAGGFSQSAPLDDPYIMSKWKDRHLPDSVSLTIKSQQEKSTSGMDTVQSTALFCTVLIFSKRSNSSANLIWEWHLGSLLSSSSHRTSIHTSSRLRHRAGIWSSPLAHQSGCRPFS